MHVEITYPSVQRRTGLRHRLLNALRWPFILSAIACVIVNLCVGGPWWCVVAVAAMYMVWKLGLSTDLVEYNRISQTIKITIAASVLLTLIDILLVPGWAKMVVPLVCLGGLVLAVALFFTNLETQTHNMMPLILYILATAVGSALGLWLWHDGVVWQFLALGGASIAALAALIIILRQEFLREMKRRFHIK